MDWGQEGALSPESTVTSLMGSSGHLPPPQDNAWTVRCGDKVYESASAALDAYIADFERSRLEPRWPTGSTGSTGPRLVLAQGTTRGWTLRNRDVLSELLTDTELHSLSLPANSVCRRGDRNEDALTTEELLAIPGDGSLPVTKTSAFLSSLRLRPPHHTPLRPCGDRLRPPAATSCQACGNRGAASDSDLPPLPPQSRWRGGAVSISDMQHPVRVGGQEVTRLQPFQAVGPEMGRDPDSSVDHQHQDSSFQSHHPTPSRLSRPDLSLPERRLAADGPRVSRKVLDLAGFPGERDSPGPLGHQRAAGPAAFWENAGLFPPRPPSWLDCLHDDDDDGEEEELNQEDGGPSLSASLLAEDSPAVSPAVLRERRLRLATSRSVERLNGHQE